MSSMACGDRGGFGAQHGVRAVGGRRRRRRSRRVAVPCWASLVMSTRTGPGRPDLRDLEGLADSGRDVFGAGDEEVVLGDGQGDAGDVDFLEGVGAEDLGGDLAGDRDDGDASRAWPWRCR